MLIPAEEELPEIVAGGTWEVSIQLFEDVAETKPFNLTGWTVALDLKTVSELTSGSGLTITPLTGLIVASLTATETAVLNRQIGYYVKLTNGSDVVFPIHGVIPVEAP